MKVTRPPLLWKEADPPVPIHQLTSPRVGWGTGWEKTGPPSPPTNTHLATSAAFWLLNFWSHFLAT